MATKKATTAKKATKKSAAKKAAKKAEPKDPREPRAPGPAGFKHTLADLRPVLETLTPPAEPSPSDLITAMVHFTFAEGLPCGVGQEAVRRLDEGFVDRNEFRLTEAFEIEEMLADLEIPNLFDRCLAVRDSVAQIYNDQNSIDLSFLREASVTDRNQFFQRVPAIQAPVARFLVDLVSFEEMLFSDRSTLRVQQRMGLDPKASAVTEFVAELKQLAMPFGHLPLLVTEAPGQGQPVRTPPLCPACIVCRLAPPGKAGKRKG